MKKKEWRMNEKVSAKRWKADIIRGEERKGNKEERKINRKQGTKKKNDKGNNLVQIKKKDIYRERDKQRMEEKLINEIFW